jgi:hypothetical protein
MKAKSGKRLDAAQPLAWLNGLNEELGSGAATHADLETANEQNDDCHLHYESRH